MYPIHSWSMVEDRDLSRAAAERHHQLQALSESRSTSSHQPRRTRRVLRRLFAVAGQPS